MSEKVNVIEESEKAITEHSIIFEEALEAILFAAGHPISYATLARVFEITPGQVKDKVLDYALKYNNTDIPRGVMLLTFKDECQLCTKEHYLTEIRSALGIKKSGTLSTSSLEALAIVAYNQPVTRAFVDTLRRADSSYAMNNLIDRGLIECKGRLDVPGRPMLYGTTSDFLRCFGLDNISKLPNTSEEISAMFERIRNNQTDDRQDGDIDGAEQIAISEEILGEAVSNSTQDNEPSESSIFDRNFEPSADDYQDLGD